ncbi:MAG: ABC transporter ATP-binding protein [Lachnospiraceae bacterium]|nr:ABC transporter ATP-binding protein [Lachnospiraceae bacterium]
MSNQVNNAQGQPPQGMPPKGQPGNGPQMRGPMGGGRGGGPMHARINSEKPKNIRKTLLRLVKVIGRSKYFLLALLLTMSIVTVLDLFGPTLQGRAIDTIRIENGRFVVDFETMKQVLAQMLVLFAVSAAFTYFQSILSAKISQDTVFAMRNDLFAKISHLSIASTDNHRHGDLMSRMTNDVENVSNAVSQSIASLFSSILTFFGALFFMLRCNVIVTLVAFITVPMTLLVSAKLAKLMRRYFVEQQKLLGKINGEVEEMVIGYKTVVAYGKEPETIERFGEISEGLRRTSIRSRVFGSIMGPCMNFLGNLQYVLVAAFGIFFVIRGKMSIGNIQAMLQYSKKFNRPINEIANQYASIMTALAGAERIFEIMDTPDEIDEGRLEVSVKDIQGNIEFDDIRFGYVPEEPVLKGLNLSVKKGQRIAIVGATGSGKTTIVNLLTRFYELDGGKIYVDDMDITELPKKTLRDSIAIVLQDTVLFADTIRANIRYGNPDATEDEIRFAAKTANADTFIERLPDGYDTVLTEGGSNLSQGQRQLLAIARAVIANPQILILDEATSNVDTRTEMHIQQAMLALMKNRTSLIIAHRLSTIRDADKIVVLRDGVIVEEGSHDELLNRKGEYEKLYRNQFAGIAT